MIKTSVTLPNIPKYSFNLSADVCQLRPPTNSLPGAESVLFGVDRPDEPECDAVVPLFMVAVVAVDATARAVLCGCCCCGITCSFLITANALCKSCEISVPFSMVALWMKRKRKTNVPLNDCLCEYHLC